MELLVSKEPHRVLFLTPYFRPYLGGIERAIEQLAFQVMASQDVRAVAVLTTKYSFPRVAHPDWTDRDSTPEGIGIYRLRGFPKWSVPLYSVPLVWFSPLQIRSYLKEFDPDVVHFVGDGWFWGHFWTWFWYRKKARFVFTPSFHVLPWQRWWLRPINAFICNVVDRVVPLTNLEAREVERAYLVPKAKQVIIGWGATPPGSASDPNKMDFNERSHPPKEGEPLTILCVGRLGLHKGQEWLINTYRLAMPEFRRPARLVCVGRDEDAETALSDLIARHNFENEVSLVGEVSDRELSEWYAKADIFALFSQYEAFGLVYFEAMAHGLPVLTHDVGANGELLVKGAIVTPRFDQVAAVGELVRLVNDDGYRESIGKDAREYAVNEFTWSAVAGKYLEVYSACEP